MEQFILSENNVPVYYDVNPYLHSIKFGLYIQCGSIYETPQMNGITHFFEHIVFRNINKIMAGKMYSELDRNAVDFNASTYKEFMCFDFFCSPNSLDFALKVFKEIFADIILTPQEINTEKNVVKSEIYEEADKGTLMYAANSEVWKGTSLTQTILGSCSKVNSLSLKKLREFRRELFSSGDMFVYVTGNAGTGDVEKIARVISDADITIAEKRRNNVVSVPAEFGKRGCKVIVKHDCFTRVQICFDFYKSEASSAEINLLTDYLLQGDSSCFYTELRENRGLIYSYNLTLEEYSNVGNIKIAFDVQRANLESTLSEIVRILNSVKTDYNDLTNAKALYRRDTERELDEPATFNWDRAYYGHICDVHPCSAEERDEQYLKTDSERISQIAKAVFSSDRLTVAIKNRKSSTVNCDAIKEIMRKLD